MNTVKNLLIMSLAILTVNAFADTNSNTTNSSTKSTNSGSNTNVMDFSGNYECKGYDPIGKSNYDNPLIVVKNGDAFNFQWMNSTKGYPILLGTGVTNNDLPNAISIVIWDPVRSTYFGTEIFAAKSDGSMTGTWVLKGENIIGNEHCVKQNS